MRDDTFGLAISVGLLVFLIALAARVQVTFTGFDALLPPVLVLAVAAAGLPYLANKLKKGRVTF